MNCKFIKKQWGTAPCFWIPRKKAAVKLPQHNLQFVKIVELENLRFSKMLSKFTNVKDLNL